MENQMQYTEIPYVNKPVSRILYGTGGGAFLRGENMNDLLDDMLALGVNTLDTARKYGDAEHSIGRWFEARGNRDEIVLLSKCAHPSDLGRKRLNERAIRKDFKRSAEALHTNYIDIYLFHRDDPSVPAGELVEIFNAMHAEGKIGAFGGSNWTVERIAEANEYAYSHNLIPFTVSSPNYGLAEQVRDPWGGGCVTLSGPSNEAARAWYRANQMPVIAYSSLGRGLFSGRLTYADRDRAGKVLDSAAMKGYGCPQNFERLRRCEELAAQKGCLVPQIAMAWLYRQGLNTFAVVSTTSKDRMQQNIDALHIELSDEETAYLDLTQ